MFTVCTELGPFYRTAAFDKLSVVEFVIEALFNLPRVYLANGDANGEIRNDWVW
jgi:hypothetical protein